MGNRARPNTATAIAVAAASALLGLGAVYVTLGRPDNVVPAAPQPTAERPAVRTDGAAAAALPDGPGANPLSRGDMAAFVFKKEREALPPLVFVDGTGKQRALAEWRGKVVLLNLWATWCAPCRKEMPALDALQSKLGGDKFEVVSVNIDTRDPTKPKAWFEEVGIKHLTYYADPSAKVFQELKAIGRAFGMPTTLLIDPHGCELAYLAGPAEWASEDAIKLVQAAIGQ